MTEILKAILLTNSGRASGKDSPPAKIYKASGPNTLEAFYDILQSVRKEKKMLENF